MLTPDPLQGLYFAFYYVGSFGRDILRVSDQGSINNLLILNAVGLPGRLVPAHLADRYFGPLNTLVPFVLVSGISLFCWIAVSSPGGLTAFAVAYGIFVAGIQSLFPATLTSLTTELKKTGKYPFVDAACGSLIVYRRQDGHDIHGCVFCMSHWQSAGWGADTASEWQLFIRSGLRRDVNGGRLFDTLGSKIGKDGKEVQGKGIGDPRTVLHKARSLGRTSDAPCSSQWTAGPSTRASHRGGGEDSHANV
ncbi:MAG: hypothetical protein L6R40_002327 [Gallowayella cf. fulva]|nr:MAG: hypothetical protein L6R40_002327 [Xanthomendoza cf. fulva]